MENLKKKIQSNVDDKCQTNLDLFSNNELKRIEEYIVSLNSSGIEHTITKLSKSDKKIEIETKTGIALL